MSVQTETPAPTSPNPERGYDVRLGAAAYAPIVGTFGALALPTIPIVFAVPDKSVANHQAVALATGLLVIGMLGSLLGAFGFAAIAGETRTTPNLLPASMYMSVPVVASVASVLGAFEVLASIYTPDASFLFVWIVVGTGVFGVLFNVFETWWLCILGSIPVVAGGVFRVFGPRIHTDIAVTYAVIAAGIGVIFLSSLMGLIRTVHAKNGPDRGARPHESLLTTLAIAVFVGGMAALLP